MFLHSFDLRPFLVYHFQVQGIFIKTISPGSVAESDGRLKVGDQILKVCSTVSMILLLSLLIALMQQLNQIFFLALMTNKLKTLSGMTNLRQ